MIWKDWSRRRLLWTAGAAVPALLVKRLRAALPSGGSIFDSNGSEYVRIDPGEFMMGEDRLLPLSLGDPLAYMTRAELQAMFPHGDPARFVSSDVCFQHGDVDEKPVASCRIEKTFYLGATQVTNREFERFDPAHRALRGKFGFSTSDDEAVIYVSWHQAEAYCHWLAAREGKPFRLPTEAEWEYAARAGTVTLFSTGDTLPANYLKNAQVTDFVAKQDKVSLRVGETPANPWGLYDVHGNVEEWVQDWYAPYVQDRAGGGPREGIFKVTRGGSHGTFAYYLRSANRSAALPETCGFTIGFRVACGEAPRSSGRVRVSPPVAGERASMRPLAEVQRGPDPAVPYFRGPKQFVKIPESATGPLFYWHNHDTSLAECPNGDLLAIWYTCAREQGRELSVAASRLAFGQEEWGAAYSFYDTPDRNDHCPALWYDGKETLYHLNGTALSHYWEPLQIILRESKDNGSTWSTPRYIAPDFGLRTMVCQPIVRLSNGWWIFGADAHPEGSAMWLSKDEGKTWEDTGGTIHGIHAAIVERKDGTLMALGRGGNVNHQLPISISDDFGKTWKAEASELPPITYTQRFSLTRLKEGPLALATFLPDVANLGPQKSTDRELAKLAICISYDDGKTWPARRLLTDGQPDHGVPGISNGRVYMGPGNAEPTGYVTITQARNGVIHVISSVNHYAFNLKWAESGPRNPNPMPSVRQLPVKGGLSTMLAPSEFHPYHVARTIWSNERTGAMDALDLSRGATVEAAVAFGSEADSFFMLRFFVRSGCTMCNRYELQVNKQGAAYRYAGSWQKVSEKVSAADASRYRLCVREDTCVQIYCDQRLLGAFPASYEIGFAPPTRGNWMEWEISAQATSPVVKAIGFDLAGPFQPV
jgi:formylglycine-generating enzyme